MLFGALAALALAPAPVDRRAALEAAVFKQSAIERPIDNRTAVDRRFSSGAVGQAGYLCGLGGIGPDGEPLHGGPEGAFGRSGAFLGASLAFPIR